MATPKIRKKSCLLRIKCHKNADLMFLNCAGSINHGWPKFSNNVAQWSMLCSYSVTRKNGIFFGLCVFSVEYTASSRMKILRENTHTHTHTHIYIYRDLVRILEVQGPKGGIFFSTQLRKTRPRKLCQKILS